MKFDSKKLLRTLTIGQGSILIPHIETYQSQGNFPDKWIIEINNFKKDDGHFHPSSDALLSPKELWDRKKSKSEPISSALRRTFDCGHMWHGYLENILIDMEFIKLEHVEVYRTKKIVTKRGGCIGAGTADLAEVNIPGYGTWLVDIKTMNKPLFETGVDQHTLAKWNAQVNCYGDWFESEKMMILAICKDSPHAMREYIIQKDQRLLDEIYDRWAYVAQCLRVDMEPDDE